MKMHSDISRNSFALLTWLSLAALAASSAFGQNANALLENSGVKGGFVVHVGCGDGSLTEALRAGPQYVVQGLDTDPAQVAKARKRFLDKGLYGPICIDKWDGRHLPYADNLVNLLVVEKPERVSEAEMLRVLAPRGVALIRQGNKWRRLVKPWPKNIDEWTHYLHGPDGNPVSNDEAVGPPRRLQWVGSPRWARHHDHMASLTAMVSAKGRVFYIIDEGPTASIRLPSRWRLVARDAFNGVVLWKREIPRWASKEFPLKSGPAHLLRRLVAVGDRVYVTLGIDAPAVALDAATGKTLTAYAGSKYTKEIVVSKGVVFLVAGEKPSRLPMWRRVSTYVWENTRRANPEWGWHGEKRKIMAYDAATGRKFWEVESPVAPCSLAVGEGRVVFHDGKKLVCLNRGTGERIWESAPAPVRIPVPTNTGPRVLIYKSRVLFAGNNGKMSGWTLRDGEKVWERKQQPCGHMSLKDLYVADGLVWTAAIANGNQDGTFTAYDPITGEKKREFPADVKVHWFHHRCYPAKATNRYILTARNGTEFIDVKTGHWQVHHWVRGGCIYGVMPCNGLMYAPMQACGCQLEAKLKGLNALAAGPAFQPDPATLSGEARLEKGPAYGRAKGPSAGPEDWPTYRHDPERSGATQASRLKGASIRSWRTQLPAGKLTPPTIAAGMVFVGSLDAHTLFALDQEKGRRLWSFTAGGPIDSPPTYYKGLVLFGSNDGYVYALRAKDGALAWRFRAAPIDRRIMAWERVESKWPVHGSVLVHKGVLYCTAGRNMFLDGGIRFLRLNPLTGELLGEVVWNDKDPNTGKDMQLVYLKHTPGNTMPVAESDILSCDGRHIWMRSQKIDFTGKRLEIALKPASQQKPPEDFHIFCEVGFLDDSYFFRSYWTYGRRTIGGYGGWYQAGRLVPEGRILCVDDQCVYGYGRKPAFMTNASVLEYQLFAADKKVTEDAIRAVGRATREMNLRSKYRSANASDWRLRYLFPEKDLTAVRFHWILDQPALLVRAMVVAGDRIFVAGPPLFIDERRAYWRPDDEDVKAKLKKQADALKGRYGAQIWALDKRTGKVLARYALHATPVFDSLAAANGRVFLTTTDGRVLGFGPAGSALPSVSDHPLRIAWSQPEDPNYLLPPPEPKESDFAKVAKCHVFSSKLGYRIRANGRKRAGVAVKKLDQPITGGVVILRSKFKAVDGGGLLRNGYIAFGDGPNDAQLVKCGVRLWARTATIVQGPLLKGKSKHAPIPDYRYKPAPVVVRVDLPAQTVTLTVGKAKVQAKLRRPLKTIAYVGYAVDSALIDAAPIAIERR